VEEEKFEFANEEDLMQNNHKQTIAASSEKIEEENFPLRNKVLKQH
jgi:hypothetical protein